MLSRVVLRLSPSPALRLTAPNTGAISRSVIPGPTIQSRCLAHLNSARHFSQSKGPDGDRKPPTPAQAQAPKTNAQAQDAQSTVKPLGPLNSQAVSQQPEALDAERKSPELKATDQSLEWLTPPARSQQPDAPKPESQSPEIRATNQSLESLNSAAGSQQPDALQPEPQKPEITSTNQSLESLNSTDGPQQADAPDPVPRSSGPSTINTPPGSAKSENMSGQQDATDAENQPFETNTLPNKPLPDLTQGIPSTLEFETQGSTKKTALGELEAAEGVRGKRELPASAYISSTEKRRLKLANYMYAALLGTVLSGLAYLGRDWDEEEERAHHDIPNGWSPWSWWRRASTRLKDSLSYYRDPAFEKLLPDPDPMFERPYTLCISLEDLLVHSEWSREHGWRIAKRPGADYFLHYLSQYYELVLFTTVPFALGDPLVRKLDPYRFIVWPLFREATKYKDGEMIKDLSYLNRDLSKVIMIDTQPKHVQNQPENAIILPKWQGDPENNDLVALIPFLEYIHIMQYKDVRDVLKSFEGKHIPTEFARREAIARAEFQKQYQLQRSKKPSGMSALGSMIGLKASNLSMRAPLEGEQSPSEAFAQGKMLQDIARDRGQRNYQLMEKEIRENGEKWLKEEAAQMEKAQAEAMAGMKSSFVGWFLPSSSPKQ